MKICFAASSGGHFEQLMRLKSMMKRYDSFILTERTKYGIADCEVPVYYVKQVNRKEKLFLLYMFEDIFKTIYIFFKEKPDAVICTGVLATIPMCVIAKLFGKKVIYIESFAKVNTPTNTGKFLYRFADQFYVQWESMKQVYPKAIYLGGIY